jgi:hypothetical protein
MTKPVLSGLIIVGVILGIMAYSMMSLTGNRVEVYIQFNSQNSCKIARGATMEDAQRTAQTNACGELASGERGHGNHGVPA